jgi:hypothetical protein
LQKPASGPCFRFPGAAARRRQAAWSLAGVPGLRRPRAPPSTSGEKAMQRPIWVFALGTSHDDKPVWYWTRYFDRVIESVGPCPTFEKCIEQAKRLGFDFSQPYHLTTIRK